MTDVSKLVARLAQQEARQRERPCLAPCVLGGKVQVRIEGLVQTYRPEPANYSGWGIFALQADGVARHLEDASLADIDRYLSRLPSARLRLACRLVSNTWLACSLADGSPHPVHLVSEGRPFDVVVARDGWFEAQDRAADATHAHRLREALRERTVPRFPGMTRDMQTCFELALDRLPLSPQERDERRLRQALSLGGATLSQAHEQGDIWHVTWRTAAGEEHVSAISRQDLTVVSAGICLSGGDRAFDLQSLPGVVDGS